MTIQANFPNVQPSLLLDFANAKQLPPQVTFTRATTAAYYDGSTTAMAEQNLVTYSQDFSNTSYWTQDQVTLTGSQTAPDGTSTAFLFTDNANNTDHRCYMFPAQIGAPFYTGSVYLKNGTRRYALLRLQSGATTAGAIFDLQTGAVASTGGSGYFSSSITSVGSGWYRCTVTSNTFSAGVSNFVIAMSNTSGYSDNIQYVGTGDTMLAWGAQLEQRSSATAYTATTTQAITNYIPVLLTAGGGQPRFDHNPTTSESLGLLIEEQRTNIAIYSADFANANWTQYNGGVITSNQMIAPDGTLTADQMDMTSTQYSGVYQSGPAGATGTCTISVWARTATGTQTFNLGFYNGIQGAVMSSNLTATTSWQRFTFTATLSGVSNIHINNYTASAGTVFIWGAQVEQGAFATSYIPTTNAAATRAADVVSMSGANFSSWYSPGNGTFYAEASTASVASDVMIAEGTNSAGSFLDFSMTFATTSTQFINRFVTTSNDMRKTAAVAANTMVKFSGSITNSSGTTIASTAGATASSTGNQGANFGADRMFIGSRGGSSLFINAPIKKLAFYPAQLTQTQQNSITG